MPPLRASLLCLLAVSLPVAGSDDRSSPLAKPTEAQLNRLRAALDRAETRPEWEATARTLLDALDRSGSGQGAEAAWLVQHLMETHPDDPRLAWRWADQQRHQGDPKGALSDLQHLIETHPEHSIAVRARRALPALFLAVGQPAESARADEALIADGLADPIPVLQRLARTYAQLGEPGQAREALDRLRALAPERVTYDPTLMWIAAETAERLDPPETAAAAMLRFANLVPDDRRRSSALLHAAKAFREVGNRELA
ncbi:MAG: tetratricopeptide repeat protein, partial [Acidobacteriota bacterium]